MNGGHVYRPLVETAGATLEHFTATGIVKPEHYGRTDRFLPGCYLAPEFVGNQVKSNHPQVFRMLSEAECRAIDRQVLRDKQAPGRWDRLRDAWATRQELNYGSRA